MDDDYQRGVNAGTQSTLRALGRGGVAVSKRMLEAAQSAYERNPEYGLTDADMRRAIKAALRCLGVPSKKRGGQ